MTRLVMALMSVCITGAVILALTDQLTSGPIAEQKRQEMVRSLDSVLPPHTNAPDQDTRDITLDNGKAVTFYLAKRAGAWVGTAMLSVAPDGYSGNIDVMVGIDTAGVLSGVAVLAHAETPGLGDKVITVPTWLPWFRGRSLDNTHWAVKKDGGDVDQFTGATITPRAVTGAVKRALEICRQHCGELAPASKGAG